MEAKAALDNLFKIESFMPVIDINILNRIKRRLDKENRSTQDFAIVEILANMLARNDWSYYDIKIIVDYAREMQWKSENPDIPERSIYETFMIRYSNMKKYLESSYECERDSVSYEEIMEIRELRNMAISDYKKRCQNDIKKLEDEIEKIKNILRISNNKPILYKVLYNMNKELSIMKLTNDINL